MYKVAALVSGGGTNLQAIIDAMDDGRIEDAQMSLVASTNSKAFALERAARHGIESIVLSKKNGDKAREDALLAALREKGIDLLVLCGCFMVLSSDFIKGLDKPIINIHPALLPKYGGKGFYGMAVHEAVLAAGESESGATVHYVDGGIDTGGIILQKVVPVLEGDTPEILQKRVMEEAEWQILPEVIAKFSKGLL